MNLDTQILFKLSSKTMPFGKYSGVALIDLPEPYVVWFYDNLLLSGELSGELKELMGLLYEIKLNGLEDLVRPLKRP